jgi:uncharacterized protein YndB with AHSA1/START domain
METIELTATFAAPPERLYRAWLDAHEHSEMTGAEATCAADGAFTAWDDYISGRNLELEPARRIVQSWRTTEFPRAAPDSRVELRFEVEGAGTRLHLRHTDIPAGQGARYAQGWREFYFQPMSAYFRR